MNARVSAKAQALRLWIASTPQVAVCRHRLEAAGYDPETVGKEIESIRRALLKRLSQIALRDADRHER